MSNISWLFRSTGRAVAVAWLLVLFFATTLPLGAHAAPLRGRAGGYRDQPVHTQGQRALGGTLGPRKPSHKLASKPTAKRSAGLLLRNTKGVKPAIVSIAKNTAIANDNAVATKKAPKRATNARQFARGLFADGPKHMWHSMVQRPAIFFGGLLAVGGIGAAGAHFDVNLEPALVVAGVAALGAQLWQGVKAIAKAPRRDRSRLIGEQLVFPTLAWAAGTAAALSMGHGPSDASVGQAAAKAMLFGGEAPANLSMAVAGAQGDSAH